MDVPFRLVRREPPRAADAFLVLADSPAPLAAACACFDTVPETFAVSGGVILLPRAVGPDPVPGAVRLARLAGDLFVPVDADLLPTLLPDEAVGLTRDRGLIVLPGGIVLSFDPTTPLTVSHWLNPPRVRRSEWQPFPRRQDRPDTLTAVERPSPPEVAVIELLGSGAPDDAQPLPGAGEDASGTIPEDARPPAGSAIGRAVSSAALAAGGFLAWLGKQFGSTGLARIGGDLARRAIERVPRLSEKLLGDQEAALREVLRQLQSGDVEKGLSRAPIAVADPDRPAHIGTDARLSRRDPRYSLRDMIGTGPATVWLGGGDVWAELAREYRRLASEAAARGDHRRAAYLYGVLLRDLRAAANALMAGGLFRDAALLFRDRLSDPRAAADAFERAGEPDEAIRLYERLQDYERAADLLRRLGEEERAVRYYTMAAKALASTGRFVAAGDMMRTKAYRRTDAIGWYQKGWLTDGAEAVTCAERLLDEYVAAEDRHAFTQLLSEAETTLSARPRDAGRLFNYALRVTARILTADAQADLVDRTRLLFASHLRAVAMISEATAQADDLFRIASQLRTAAMIGEAGALAGELFKNCPPWDAPIGRDAAFAVQKRPPIPAKKEEVAPPIVRRITDGPVTAVAVARGTCDLVVAGANGIVFWRVTEGRFVPVATMSGERVLALSSSARGELVYAVVHGTDGNWSLRCYAADRAGAFRAWAQHPLEVHDAEKSEIYLQAEAVFCESEYRIVAATPARTYIFVGPRLRIEESHDVPSDAPVHFVADAGSGRLWKWEGNRVSLELDDETLQHMSFGPLTPTGPVSWRTPGTAVLEVALIDTEGCVRWAQLDARDRERYRDRNASATCLHGYTTVTFVAPDTLVAVTRANEVHWLHVTSERITVRASVTVSVPVHVFALAAQPDPDEVVAILADGGAVRLRRPGRS